MMTDIASTILAEATNHHSITLFDNAYSTQPAYEGANLAPIEVASLIASYEGPHATSDKHHAPFFVASTLKEAEFVGKTRLRAIAAGIPTVGKQRSGVHVVEGSFGKSDFDGITDEEAQKVRAYLDKHNIAYLLYTTHSHGREGKPGNRLRLIVFFDRPLPPDEYQRAVAALSVVLLGQSLDPSEARLSQQAGVWAAHPDRVGLAFCERRIAGRYCVSADALLALAPKAQPAAPRRSSAGVWGDVERQKVHDALQFIDPNEYATWVTVCTCLAALAPVMGDEARTLWTTYSGRGDEASQAGNNRSGTDPEQMFDRMTPSMGAEAALGTLMLKAKDAALDIAERDIEAGTLTDAGYAAVRHLNTYHKAALQLLFNLYDVEVKA